MNTELYQNTICTSQKNATLGTFKVKINKILFIARSVKIHFKRLCYRPNLLGYILLQLVSFQTKSRDKLP